MRGISNKTKFLAELIAAGRIAWVEADYVEPADIWPYTIYKDTKSLEWRLSSDIVDSYYNW